MSAASASDSGSFQSLDVARFHEVLSRIHQTVHAHKSRVEVTRQGCDDVCVLISKCELDALERALELLTECAEYKAMCSEVAQVAAATSVLTPTFSPVA